MPERREQIRSVVHAFDIARPGRAAYPGSGALAGRVPSHWAMSEHAGDLRVATTTGTWRRPDDPEDPAESAVSVLRPVDGRLVEIGRPDGLGRGENLYAVRWFDGMAAMVTYRQVDPVHLVDLSVPERPTLCGELEIPGYSAYLHPLGGHRLLGVGQGAAGQAALEVSSFDIADPDAPRRTDTVNFGAARASSYVEEDPRRFLYLPDVSTAVLPAEIELPYRCAREGACDGMSPAEACKRGLCREAGLGGAWHGLIAIRVGANGAMGEPVRWRSTGAWAGEWVGYPRLVAVALPDGRIAALDRVRLTVLDADLRVLGYAAHPVAR